MAPFNPAINPTQDPNWLGLSKSITQPDADKSMESLFSGSAAVLDSGVKTADFLVKSKIQDEIHAEVDKQNSGYQNVLAKARQQYSKANPNITPSLTGEAAPQSTDAEGGGIGTDAVATGDTNKPLDLLKDTTPLPGDLENLGTNAETLVNARANGRLSPTDYYGRLDAMAKDFRARYPGYREYIDQTMEKTTGFNAANKYVTSLLGDINSYITQNNSQQAKDEAFFRRPENFAVLGPERFMQLRNGTLPGGVAKAYELVHSRLL